MAKTKTERLNDVHAQAMREFDGIQSAMRDERMQCLEDRRFYSIAGAQWEGDLGQQFANRPKFEINKIHLSVIRIINEYRNNRIDVAFQPKDGVSNDDLADTCAGLYRADEKDSGAQEAFDNGFEEAVGGGFGAWRVCNNYIDDEDEDDPMQRIGIEPIYDADSSVFFDLDAKRQDKADAKKCFVLTSMTRDGYAEAYPEDDPAAWPKIIHQSEFDWLTPDVVFVAEYYCVEETKELVHIYRGLDGSEKRVTDKELQDDEDMDQELKDTGFTESMQKRVKRRRVHKYIMSGNKVLSDEGYIAGRNIPIIPMYGKRWFVDNVERCMGHVRLAKDAQRLKNMQISAMAEMAAQFSVEKPIFTPEQVAGHSVAWSEDNVKKYPYLLINSITDANGQQMPSGPIAYTRAPTIPQAMAALLQITEQDMQDLLGNQQAGEQMVSNIAEKTVEMIQQRLDMQTFIYMSNMAKAVKRTGEVWLSMAKDVMIEEGRTTKTVDDKGQVSSIELMTPTYDEKTGKAGLANDLSKAKFDVDVTVGPSSASKRSATVRSLTGMMQITQTDPETTQVLAATALMNMEGEGIQDIRDYYRKKMVRMGVVKPTDEEIEAMPQEQANIQPDPQAEYLKAAAEQASADAASKRADTVETIANADLKRAQTAKTIAETMNGGQAHQLASVGKLQDMLQKSQPQAPNPVM